MPDKIKTISLALPYRLGIINCYLIENREGYVLIDTGCSNRRSKLEEELKAAGCRPGNLKLIVLTHGDFDHAGNAAYISRKFGAEIAIHINDSGIVEHGDMFRNRKKRNDPFKLIAPVVFRFGKSDRFKPNILLLDGDELSKYGLEAKVVHIPGHTKGSIGILTADGGLFCGDMFTNRDRPTLNAIIDDLEEAKASFEKLKELKINAVYPGHGKPFYMDKLLVS